MYMTTEAVEQQLQQAALQEAQRRSARYGHYAQAPSAAYISTFGAPAPNSAAAAAAAAAAEAAAAIEALSTRAELPQSARSRPRAPPLMLRTDRRALEREGPDSGAWGSGDGINDEPEVLLPDEYVHPESQWRVLQRPETLLDVHAERRARQQQRRQMLRAPLSDAELQQLLDDDDEDTSWNDDVTTATAAAAAAAAMFSSTNASAQSVAAESTDDGAQSRSAREPASMRLPRVGAGHARAGSSNGSVSGVSSARSTPRTVRRPVPPPKQQLHPSPPAGSASATPTAGRGFHTPAYAVSAVATPSGVFAQFAGAPSAPSTPVLLQFGGQRGATPTPTLAMGLQQPPQQQQLPGMLPLTSAQLLQLQQLHSHPAASTTHPGASLSLQHTARPKTAQREECKSRPASPPRAQQPLPQHQEHDGGRGDETLSLAELQRQLRELRASLHAEQARSSVLAAKLAAMGVSADDDQRPTQRRTRSRTSSASPLPDAASGDHAAAESVQRALGQQRLALRSERHSLTQEKARLLTESAEIAREKERLCRERNSLSATDAPLPPRSPSSLAKDEAGRAADVAQGSAGQQDEGPDPVESALIKQNRLLLSARRSMRVEERDVLLRDIAALQAAPALTEAQRTELHTKLLQVGGGGVSSASARSSASAEKTGNDGVSAEAALRRMREEVETASKRAADEAQARAAAEAQLAQERATHQQRTTELQQALDAERAALVAEKEAVQRLQQLQQQAAAEIAAAQAEQSTLRAQLSSAQAAHAEEAARLQSQLQESLQERAVSEKLLHELRGQSAARLHQQAQLNAERASVAEAQGVVDRRLAELEHASALLAAEAERQRAAAAAQEEEHAAAHRALAAELEQDRRAHAEKLRAQTVAHQSAQAVSLKQAHTAAHVLWHAERAKLEELFHAACDEQRVKLALDHHEFVTSERAAIKTAAAQLERDRRAFEQARQKFIDMHPGFIAPRDALQMRQNAAARAVGAASVSAAALAAQQQEQHQTATAASLASLQAAIGSGKAALLRPAAPKGDPLTPSALRDDDDDADDADELPVALARQTELPSSPVVSSAPAPGSPSLSVASHSPTTTGSVRANAASVPALAN